VIFKRDERGVLFDHCECDLCVKERQWEEEHGTCYRCIHLLPCIVADENGHPCTTILDQIAKAV